MLKSLDYIGGVNYIPVIVKHHPVGWGAGFLCKASGWKNGIKAARKLARTGKCPTMRIHGLWDDYHHFTKRDIKPAVKQAKKVAVLAERYPNIEFYYSPWLEHRASKKLFKKCRRACRKVLPKRVKIVSSGLVPGKGITEVHGNSFVPNGPFIYSFDGTDMFECNVDYYMHEYGSAILFFGWTQRCNGEQYKPRHLRTKYLRKQDIERMVSEMKWLGGLSWLQKLVALNRREEGTWRGTSGI